MSISMKAIKTVPKGFTILELMTVVVILAATLTFAIPSFSDFVERQAVKSDINRLSKAFANARSQAMTLQMGSTSVCWNNGIAEVIPGNLAGTPARIPPRSLTVFEGGPDSDDGYGEIISILDVDVARLSYQTDDDDNCIGFNSQGRLTQSNANGVSFAVCKDENDNANSYRIDITIGGRVSVRENTSLLGQGPLNCS